MTIHARWARVMGQIIGFALVVVLLMPAFAQAADISDEAKVKFNSAVEFATAKKPDSAIAAYEAAISLAPDYLQAHINVGALYYDKGDMTQAAEHLNKAVSLDSNNVAALKSLGLVHFKADRYADAVAALNHHNALDKTDAGVWSTLGLAHKKLGDDAKALAAYEEAVRLDPKDYKTFYNIGNIHQEAKDFEDAIGAYSKAIAVNSGYIEAYYNKAISSHQLDQDACVPDYEAFIKAAQGKAKWKKQVDQASQIVKQIKEYLDSQGE
ncbi:MAG: tetratricopeptide repeat protein [Candidatus Zixiibacteriota bacterium]